MAQAGYQNQSVFQYIAYDKNHGLVKGKLIATSEQSVAELLSYEGYQIVSIEERAPLLNLEKIKGLLSNKVKASDIVLFYRQMALLLESGINIITALELLKNQMSNRLLSNALNGIIADLRAGNQLSAAMAKYPRIFSPLYCRSLSVGEQTGGLEVILRQIADYMEKDNAAVKKIKSAMVYPVLALVMTVVVVGILITFVIPAFSGLYSSLGAELPLLTRILISASDILRAYGVYLVIGLIVISLLIIVYTRTSSGKYKRDKFLLWLPLLGRVAHLNELAHCCKSIALLYRAGLPLPEIMALLIEGTNNSVMAEALASVRRDMLTGERLSQPMSRYSIFLPMMVQMTKVGEETGNLDTNLSAVAQSYETEAEDRTRSLIAMIQPATTLIIGGVVALIALSLVSAMYSVYGQMS
ncbi:type II secretion system F family protein [Chloroflexota bacterium]